MSAFLKLRCMDPAQPSFLLESAEQGQRMGRYSFIGLRPRSVLRWSLADGGDPYALAAGEVAAPPAGAAGRRCGRGGWASFTGGAVGYFGYDLVRTVEPLGEPNPDELGLPDMALMLSDLLVIFDHLKHTVTILVNADLDAEPDIEHAYAAAAETIAEVRARLAGPVPREGGATDGGYERGRGQGDAELPARTWSAESSKAWSRGSSSTSTRGTPFRWCPRSAGRPRCRCSRSRSTGACARSTRVPYMYFLDFGDFQVVGASPEPLLTVNGRHVSTRPIAGTRPRGATPEEDRRIAGELLADEKERAEHVMMVDLGRNDLGRVCEYGSVKVDEMMEVEFYSHVMHIVSSVSGTLREEVGAMDALRSVLPAGTLSGAPKVRAMQIIDELEPIKRGGYGGAIGYLSYAGDLDTAIHIRTVVVKDGVAHVQAGGGTVADAKPEYEYEESVAKSRAVMQAIELACEQADWP